MTRFFVKIYFVFPRLHQNHFLKMQEFSTPNLKKIVMVGDSNVGKSSLIHRFVEDTFIPGQQNTIGVDFFSKKMQIGGKTHNIQIWDTAGQERFKSMVKSYFRSASATVLVFDLSKRQSFDNLHEWLDEIKIGLDSNAPVIMVGNKSDLGDQRAVSEKTAKGFAGELGMDYFEASAKNAEGVEKLFETIIEKAIQYESLHENENSLRGPDVHLTPKNKEKKNKDSSNGCCGSS